MAYKLFFKVNESPSSSKALSKLLLPNQAEALSYKTRANVALNKSELGLIKGIQVIMRTLLSLLQVAGQIKVYFFLIGASTAGPQIKYENFWIYPNTGFMSLNECQICFYCEFLIRITRFSLERLRKCQTEIWNFKRREDRLKLVIRKGRNKSLHSETSQLTR